MRRYGLPWGAMVLLVGLELAAMAVGVPQVAPGLGLVMVGIVVMGPMGLGTAPRLAWVFALAGVFWLVLALFALGTLDPLTRHHVPTTMATEPGAALN